MEAPKIPKYLKIFIVVMAFIAFIVVASEKERCTTEANQKYYLVKYTDIDHGTFFVLIFVLLFLSELALLILYQFSFEYLTTRSFNWYFAEMVFTAFAAFMTLLAVCLLSDGIADAKDYYEGNPAIRCNLKYSTWEFGVAAGFFALFAMIAQCWFLGKELQQSGYMAIDAVSSTNQPSGGQEQEVTVSV
eukprot:m.333039 g.333039  ORF g.333039 m.333039 type:complete len:189 (+) comp17052_c0_seq1:107-673(+)